MKWTTLLLLLVAGQLLADDFTGPGTRHTYMGVFGGAAGTVHGRENGTSLVFSGFEFGRTLTKPKENSRVAFGYTAECVPLFVVFQDEPAFAVEITPLLLRWDFRKFRPGVIPFLDVGAGILFSRHEVPEGTSAINFTPQGGFGLSISQNGRQALTLEGRYLHISNGGLKVRNRGLNSVQIRVGFRWILH